MSPWLRWSLVRPQTTPYGPMKGDPSTTLAFENSEVSPVFLLVAVAATTVCPSKETPWVGEKLKEALPCLLVLTCVWPRNVLPSP